MGEKNETSNSNTQATSSNTTPSASTESGTNPLASVSTEKPLTNLHTSTLHNTEMETRKEQPKD